MARSRRTASRKTPSRKRGPRSRTTVPLAPKSSIPTGALLFGAGAIGIVAFVLWKSASDASAAALSTATGETGLSGVPSGVTGRTPRSSGLSNQRGSTTFNGPVIPDAVARRLNSSETARQVFAVQALIYSFHTSDQMPDGLASTLNGQLSDLNAISGGSVGSRFSSSSLAQVRQYLFGQDPGRALRSLPFVMPQAEIEAVNLSAAQMDSQFVYLQAVPAQMVAAGYPIAPAG